MSQPKPGDANALADIEAEQQRAAGILSMEEVEAAIQRANDNIENATWLHKILQQPITWEEG